MEMQVRHFVVTNKAGKEDEIHGLPMNIFWIGDINPSNPTLVRLHSACQYSRVFHSCECDCRQQQEASLKMIGESGGGLFVHLNQEGRGHGSVQKARIYQLQDQGLDTVDACKALGIPADNRDYSVAAFSLVVLGISRIRLITNNPAKEFGVEKYGLTVVDRVPVVITGLNVPAMNYLRVKREKMGHEV